MVPLGLHVGTQYGGAAALIIPLAMAASSAMCLPISTPPNAIAFSMERVRSRDFLVGGLIAGVIGPLLSIGWVQIALPWIT
jgi:sodium-dependent dicarboxylate transporter 2/3/5